MADNVQILEMSARPTDESGKGILTIKYVKQSTPGLEYYEAFSDVTLSDSIGAVDAWADGQDYTLVTNLPFND